MNAQGLVVAQAFHQRTGGQDRDHLIAGEQIRDGFAQQRTLRCSLSQTFFQDLARGRDLRGRLNTYVAPGQLTRHVHGQR